MKKVININFQGQVIAIEEAAYEILKQYVGGLKAYFSREEGGEEIVNDIESRIAELFGNRLKHGIHCITDEDVEAVINSIGRPQDFDTDYEGESVQQGNSSTPPPHEQASAPYYTPSSASASDRQGLYRNANDKIIGGVCSGLAHYFKTDPVWVRLLFVLFFGFLFWIYIVLWIVLKPMELESNVMKRLYRNPNDRYLGGVCGGIAAYFRIDSWIPRLLFLTPLLLNMVGMISIFPLNRIFDDIGFNWNINSSLLIAYVVLWAIIPSAKTVKQKLEMMGEEEYIRTIREKVSDNLASSRSRSSNDASVKPEGESEQSFYAAQSSTEEPVVLSPSTENMPPVPPTTEHRTHATPSHDRSGCLNGLLVLLKILFFSFVGIFLLSLLAVFIGLMATGTYLSPLKSLFVDAGYETNLLFTALGLLFLLPVVAVIVWVVRRSMKAKSRPVIGLVVSILWIAGIVLSCMLGVRVADKFSVESSNEKSIVLVPTTSEKLYVEMMSYRKDYAELGRTSGIFGNQFNLNSEIEELPYTTINEDSLLFNNINLQIGKSTDSLFHVRVISALYGSDLRSAKADLTELSYDVIQNDSILLLPEFLSVPVEQGFRNQSITVEISVPAGKTVEMSEALSDYKDNRPPAVVRKRIRNESRNSNYVPVDLTF